MRTCRCPMAPLLSSGAFDPRVVSDLSGRSRRAAQARAIVSDARPRRHGHSFQVAQSGRESEAGDGISAGESPARLPGLRSGRRVSASGLFLSIWPQPVPLRGRQAEETQKRRRLKRAALQRPLHHIVYALASASPAKSAARANCSSKAADIRKKSAFSPASRWIINSAATSSTSARSARCSIRISSSNSASGC